MNISNFTNRYRAQAAEYTDVDTQYREDYTSKEKGRQFVDLETATFRMIVRLHVQHTSYIYLEAEKCRKRLVLKLGILNS